MLLICCDMRSNYDVIENHGYNLLIDCGNVRSVTSLSWLKPNIADNTVYISEERKCK